MNVYILIRVETDKYDGEEIKTNVGTFISEKEVELVSCNLNTLLKIYNGLGSEIKTMTPSEVIDFSFSDEYKVYRNQKDKIVEQIRLIDKNFTDYYKDYEYTMNKFLFLIKEGKRQNGK